MAPSMNTNNSSLLSEREILEWVELKKEVDRSFDTPETAKDKFMKKAKKNPFVPIGCLATACILCFGIYNMKTGNSRMSQKMMRWRVGAQGLTIAAIIGGIAVSAMSTGNE